MQTTHCRQCHRNAVEWMLICHVLIALRSLTHVRCRISIIFYPNNSNYIGLFSRKRVERIKKYKPNANEIVVCASNDEPTNGWKIERIRAKTKSVGRICYAHYIHRMYKIALNWKRCGKIDRRHRRQNETQTHRWIFSEVNEKWKNW